MSQPRLNPQAQAESDARRAGIIASWKLVEKLATAATEDVGKSSENQRVPITVLASLIDALSSTK